MKLNTNKSAYYLFFLVQAAFAQSEDKLCTAVLKPEMGKLTVHWDSFNMFGSRKETFSETSYTQVGEGSSCKITSVRDNGKTVERPCTWNPRISCDLVLGKEPVTHKFSSGSFQYGKLQWIANEKLAVNVKQGDKTTVQEREVAVIKWGGTWSNGPSRGESVATLYYDRTMGLLLKSEGAHDANKFGDTVTLIEVKP